MARHRILPTSTWLARLGTGLVTGLVAALPLLAGCDSKSAPSPEIPPVLSISARAFLEKVPTAPFETRFSGQRHVRLTYALGGTPHTLEYDELVISDGHGQFSIVPGAVAAPPMTQEQAELFAVLQERRDGFFFRYRDFRIRDLRGFLRNWTAYDTGLEQTIAGRVCSVLEFRRSQGTEATSWYRAWIDPQTGLVLRSDEFDADGNQLARVDFRSFTLTPDLSQATLHGDRSLPAPIDMAEDTTASLGFRLLQPRILPDGYRQEKAESVTDGTNTWARLVYGDGVEQLFFLQTAAAVAPSTGDMETMELRPATVRVFHVGPWTVAQGNFRHVRAIVMGKTDEPTLLRMLKSAIH